MLLPRSRRLGETDIGIYVLSYCKGTDYISKGKEQAPRVRTANAVYSLELKADRASLLFLATNVANIFESDKLFFMDC